MWLNFTHHHHKYYQDSFVLKAAETITKLASPGGSIKMMEYEDNELISSHRHTKTTPIHRMTLWEQPEDYQNNSSTIKCIKEKPHRDRWEAQRHNLVRTHTSSRQRKRGRGYLRLRGPLYGAGSLSVTSETPTLRTGNQKDQPLNWFWRPGGFMTKSTYFNFKKHKFSPLFNTICVFSFLLVLTEFETEYNLHIDI